MPWPTPQDYNEAIQNPRQNFEDPELAAGSPETTPLGLPRPITGNFASVYRLKCSGRDWAVRCFWREYTDMQERYSAISRHLAMARLPYTVGFEYLPRGIKIRGQWYPVLKMEWVEGELLIPYIERNLHDSQALLRLARSWSTMTRTIERAGVAHGDLQHGNVLIVSGTLKLVDYDGMYVPALHGKGSHELGHQHYQHPARTSGDFAPTTDRFSGWVVYLSLLALSRNPELWTRLQAGDECLLFRKSDFLAPSTSSSLRAVAASGDDQLQALVDSFRVAIGSGPANVPSLEIAEPPPVTRGFQTTLLTPLQMLWPQAGRSAANSSMSEPGTSTWAATSAPPWLADHLAAKSEIAHFHGPRVPARVLTGTAATIVVAMAVGETIHLIASILLVIGTCVVIAVGNVGAFLTWFHRNPEVRTMKRILKRERLARRELDRVDRQMRQLRRESVAREQQTANLHTRLLEAKERLIERAQQETAESKQALETSLQRVADGLKDLSRRQQEEISSALEAFQSSHVRHELSRRTVRSAKLSNVSTVHRLRLWAMGIRSAADVTAEGISALRTLDESAIRSIVAWRVDAELQARRSTPKLLPAEQLERLAYTYGKERARMEAAERQAREKDRLRVESITAALKRDCAPLDERLKRLEEGQVVARRELEDRLAGCNQQRALTAVHLARIQRELEPHIRFTFGRFVRATLLAP